MHQEWGERRSRSTEGNANRHIRQIRYANGDSSDNGDSSHSSHSSHSSAIGCHRISSDDSNCRYLGILEDHRWSK